MTTLDELRFLPPEEEFVKLGRLPSRTLFYPCAYLDWHEPVRLFVPRINVFWFADTFYFSGATPQNTLTVFKRNPEYTFIDRSVSLPDLSPDDWMNDRKYRGIAPSILTEKYLHRQSQTIITLHRHHRRGPSALRKELSKISVFFYRRDSADGGSGTFWLTSTATARKKGRDLPALIIDKLDDSGWLVTDGSMCYGEKWRNPYLFLIETARKIERNWSFNDLSIFDLYGNCFTLIGGGPPKDRPLLFWRITKAK